MKTDTTEPYLDDLLSYLCLNAATHKTLPMLMTGNLLYLPFNYTQFYFFTVRINIHLGNHYVKNYYVHVYLLCYFFYSILCILCNFYSVALDRI